MDEIREFFQTIIRQSNTPDAEVTVSQQRHIIIDIDRPLRSNRRSSILRFQYSEQFISDHPQVLQNTPQEKILRVINSFDFNNIYHSEHEPRPIVCVRLNTGLHRERSWVKGA